MPPILKVSEIFHSLQGEGSRTGRPCSFVRLAGCNLRCHWCDSRYAWDVGREMSIDDIIEALDKFGCGMVEVTGGEPLAQPAAGDLLSRLLAQGRTTLLETNGSIDLSGLDKRVIKIVDIKCPSSGQQESFHWPNLQQLTRVDEVKFVLADRADFIFATRIVLDQNIAGRCEIIFSPVASQLEPAKLAKWILESSLDVRLGLQLHKILWPLIDRGV